MPSKRGMCHRGSNAFGFLLPVEESKVKIFFVGADPFIPSQNIGPPCSTDAIRTATCWAKEQKRKCIPWT